VAAAGTIGPIIPPSIPLVIYGSIASVSIGRLLLAGAVPGVLMGIMLMIFIYGISKNRKYPSGRRVPWTEVLQAAISAIPPMGMPAIIVGGIILGVMTPTEAAAAGAAYAFILGFFIYHEITLAQLPKIILESVIGTASIVIIMSAAQPFGWILTYELAPQKILSFVENFATAQWQILLLINVAMLLIGCFMETLSVMIMSVPLLLPLLQYAQIDLVHFGVFLVINVMIGSITPPVGTIMYVVCGLSKVSIVEFSREVFPFIIALVLAMMIVTYVPILSMWLPNLIMPAK
jgi:C4-dicarboxylate transporter DctM subunit